MSVRSPRCAPLIIRRRLGPEDAGDGARRRNVVSRREGTLRDVAIRLAVTGKSLVGSTGDEGYGEIGLSPGGRSSTTRSTSPREILPLLYELAGVSVPAPAAGADYPGYPLVANAQAVLPWFLGVLPLLVVLLWWWSRRAPLISLPNPE